eukprot:3283037-Prymnesium_polylepis.1
MSRHLSRDISWIPKFLGIYRDLSSIWLRQKTRHLSIRLSRLTRPGQSVPSGARPSQARPNVMCRRTRPNFRKH